MHEVVTLYIEHVEWKSGSGYENILQTTLNKQMLWYKELVSPLNIWSGQ